MIEPCHSKYAYTKIPLRGTCTCDEGGQSMRIIAINQLNYFSTLYVSHETCFGSYARHHHQADTTPNKNYYVNRIMLFYSSIYLAKSSTSHIS